MIGEALGVIARRHGDDAAFPFLPIERRQAVQRAALLECGRELQVLELEPDAAAENAFQRAARVAVGDGHGARDRARRLLDIGERDSRSVGVGSRHGRALRWVRTAAIAQPRVGASAAILSIPFSR